MSMAFAAFLSVLGLILAAVLTLSKKAGKTIRMTIALVSAGLLFLSQSVAIVPTGYTGVRTTFGQVSQATVPQGINWKIPFVQSIDLVNNKQQDIAISTQVWGETSEKTPVYAKDVTVTYQISGAKSAWLYSNVSRSDKDLITDSLVSSAIKAAMVQLNANDVTNRAKIEPMVKTAMIESLNEKYGENTIAVQKVVINNMDFEDSYNAAISEKSIAQQAYEKQKIENDTAIEKAEADKKVAITNAEAAAETTKIAANAEAEANATIAKSLSDEILRSKFYEKWDGKLPTVLGQGSTIYDVTGADSGTK
jgi:regulator of protease activity HflC (stomatin/prohibitin superfamily)